jgi:cytochrome c5
MSEAAETGHTTSIQTPGQLIAAVVLAFAVPIGFVLLVVNFVTGGLRIDHGSRAMSETAVAERLKPVGELVIAEGGAAGGQRTGEQVVQSVCQTCHGAGLLNSPKIGDHAAWKPRLAQGENTLIQHAIKGIRTMPPKGGNPDLTDVEVARAVVYMANKSGGNLKEPPASASSLSTCHATYVISACGECEQCQGRRCKGLSERVHGMPWSRLGRCAQDGR